MVRCAPPRIRTAVCDEAGEAGAAARCCYRADGNIAFAVMLDAGTGPPASLASRRLLHLSRSRCWRCGGGAWSRRTTTKKKRRKKNWREFGYGGREGKLGCEPAKAGWSTKGVSSDARVGTVDGSESVRSSQRAATFSIDAMARVGRCGREADGWVEEMVVGRLDAALGIDGAAVAGLGLGVAVGTGIRDVVGAL